MTSKTTRRRLGREGKRESLVHHIEYDDPPATREEAEQANARELFDALTHHETKCRETLRNATQDAIERKLTPEWWAAYILQAARFTRHYIAFNNTVQAARWAMIFQSAVDQQFVASIEHATLVGLDTKFAKYSQDDRHHWERMAAELRNDNPRVSVRAMARTIAAQTGHGEAAIREHISRYVNAG